ncbi:hypothetical protein D3C87_2035630 [compost metagenome]
MPTLTVAGISASPVLTGKRQNSARIDSASASASVWSRTVTKAANSSPPIRPKILLGIYWRARRAKAVRTASPD